MKDCIEPYAKENNILQLGLFYFGDKKPDRTQVVWSDAECDYKLECICKYGVPGSFDQDVYTACMRIWVKQGMDNSEIRLNYSDIARELHLIPPKDWVGKIKKALQRLAQARYEFTKCFLQVMEDGVTQIDTHFSLFDSASLFSHRDGKSKRNSESRLIFPKEIQKNLEAKYYQFLDMVWYRTLPEGLPRRLYEYLAKRHYHNINGVFMIKEEAICRWLPIMDKNVTNRRKRLAGIAQALITAGFLSAYLFDAKRRICTFTYAKNIKDQVEKLAATCKEELLPATPIPSVAALQAQPVTQNTVVSPPPPPATISPTTESIPTPAPNAPAVAAAYKITETEEVSPMVKVKYLEALKWLDTIAFFHKKRKDDIATLPFKQVAELFSGIRQKYEEMCQENKKPKPGWIYDAFMEKWRFTDSSAVSFPETKEGRWARVAKRLFDSWPETKQRAFIEALRGYLSRFLLNKDDVEAVISKGMWGTWAPKFMEINGLIKPASHYAEAHSNEEGA